MAYGSNQPKPRSNMGPFILAKQLSKKKKKTFKLKNITVEKEVRKYGLNNGLGNRWRRRQRRYAEKVKAVKIQEKKRAKKVKKCKSQ